MSKSDSSYALQQQQISFLCALKGSTALKYSTTFAIYYCVGSLDTDNRITYCQRTILLYSDLVRPGELKTPIYCSATDDRPWFQLASHYQCVYLVMVGPRSYPQTGNLNALREVPVAILTPASNIRRLIVTGRRYQSDLSKSSALILQFCEIVDTDEIPDPAARDGM